MDLRKVQLTGGSSMAVTLPKPWVQKVGLKPGDVVACTEQNDGSLAVHAHAKRATKGLSATIELGADGEDALFRSLVAAYLMGCDEIEIEGKGRLDARARRDLRDAVRRIIGLEVIDEDAHRVTVQAFLDPREFHMDKALRRMGLLTHAMQDEAMSAILHEMPDVLESTEDRDTEVDRLHWLINRQYHALLRDASYAAKMGLSTNQALNVVAVARLVERTADHACRIAEESQKVHRDEATTDLLAVLEQEARHAVTLFRNSLRTFRRPDLTRANEIIDEANAFVTRQDELVKRAAHLGSEAVSHLIFIIESIGRTAAYAADVCEVVINHEVASRAEKENTADKRGPRRD